MLAAVLDEAAPCQYIFNPNFKAQMQLKQAKQVLPQLYLITVLHPIPQPVAEGVQEHGGAQAGLLSRSLSSHDPTTGANAGLFASSKTQRMCKAERPGFVHGPCKYSSCVGSFSIGTL